VVCLCRSGRYSYTAKQFLPSRFVAGRWLE
jgi:hypothetical protein